MATKNNLPDAQGISEIRENQISQGDYITPEEMAALTGGARDESDLTDARREHLDCQEDKWWLVWVSNPNDIRNKDRSNEVQQVMDKYRGSKVVIDPDTGEEVRYEDMCLMARPAKYKPVVEELEKNQAKAYLANNPMTAGALGLSDAEIRELRYKFCDPEALRNRDEQFGREDHQRFKQIADGKRQSWQRNLKAGSPTYKMPLSEAYESQLRIFARENGFTNRKEAETEYRKHVEHLQAKARSGGRSDGGASEWKNDVARMMSRTQGKTFGGFDTTFGQESRQLRYSREQDNKRRSGAGGKN